MKVIEPGHVYQLDTLDGAAPNRLVFVNREPGTEHAGTQTQEVLRTAIDALSCLIDRTNHCDGCLRWEGNDRIIKALSEAQRQMRLAILHHEARALERKLDRGDLKPEGVPVGADGHFVRCGIVQFDRLVGDPSSLTCHYPAGHKNGHSWQCWKPCENSSGTAMTGCIRPAGHEGACW